jgi:hypothetical protein
MKEFMFLIHNDGADKEGLSPVKHQQFLNDCKSYINELKREGKLISAQPLIREGKIISGTPKAWTVSPFNQLQEVQVGYYHILAKDIDEAIDIAKKNPEFYYSNTAKIEVRPVKMAEETTGFIYPGKSI